MDFDRSPFITCSFFPSPVSGRCLFILRSLEMEKLGAQEDSLGSSFPPLLPRPHWSSWAKAGV